MYDINVKLPWKIPQNICLLTAVAVVFILVLKSNHVITKKTYSQFIFQYYTSSENQNCDRFSTQIFKKTKQWQAKNIL